MKSRLASEVSRQHDMGLMELARLRQGCYRFFGALFLYPDEERLTNLTTATGELQEVSESLAAFPFFGPWRRLLTTLQGLTDGESIEGEYTRLFVVNPAAPLYESFYIDPKRRATGWITAQLAREYTERGLALSPSLRKPPDHVAVELEFMAYLCGLEAQTWQREASEEGIQLLEGQHAFLGQHLARWFPAFTRQVAAADQKGLYAATVEAADAFIHHDRDLVDLLLRET
jgi:anaerobic sulfite reductase subunit A